MFAYGYWQSILERTQQDGMLLARLLAQSISFIQQAPVAIVEDLVSDAVLAQANIVAHLIQIARKRKASRAGNQSGPAYHVADPARKLPEIWVTDRQRRSRFLVASRH